jgi:hypothetical protein
LSLVNGNWRCLLWQRPRWTRPMKHTNHITSLWHCVWITHVKVMQHWCGDLRWIQGLDSWNPEPPGATNSIARKKANSRHDALLESNRPGRNLMTIEHRQDDTVIELGIGKVRKHVFPAWVSGLKRQPWVN